MGRYSPRAIFDKEPVALAAFVKALLVVGVSFGLALTPEQIVGLVLVLELGFGLLTRGQVTPTSKLNGGNE